MHPYVDAVLSGTVLFDGAAATNLPGAGAFGPPCEELVRTMPQTVRELHRSFLEAGCAVVTTNTFSASPAELARRGSAQDSTDLNLRAAVLARQAVMGHPSSASGRTLFVAGSVGPGSHEDRPESRILPSYQAQAEALLEGSVDLLVLETFTDATVAGLAMRACRQAMRQIGRAVPLQLQASALGPRAATSATVALLGALATLEPDVIGLNCMPLAQAEAALHALGERATIPLVLQPSPTAGPLAHARAVSEVARRFGAAVVGGCCGTTPEHMRAISQALSPTREALP